MATRTRTGNSAKTEVQFKSKSDHARALFAAGKTVAEVTRIVPDMGYAFAYGVAKRYGYAQTAANRRKTKTVSVENGVVSIVTSIGTIRVHPDGTVVKPTVKTARPKAG